MRTTIVLLGWFSSFACTADGPASDSRGAEDDGIGSASLDETLGQGSSSGASTGPRTSDSDGGGSEDGADTGGLKLDVGAAEGTGAEESAGDETCKRVDVVISIDNSGSMQEEIDALAGPVFDSFPMTLLDVGNGLDDFQLGVIDACNNPPFLHDYGASGDCMFSTGTNFMSSTSPDLLGEYQCVTELTQQGYGGMQDACSTQNDDEQPANTSGDALSGPAILQENAGFVRDDAILFVVAITDEDEQPVPLQSAQEIADKIIAAKGTIDNVVFLGIGGAQACDDGAYGKAKDAEFLREITDVFVAADRGLFWDLCQGDLEEAFQNALAIVDSACVEFEPPG